MPLSPEVAQYLGEGDDDPAMPGPSPEVLAYLKKAGIEPIRPKGLGEAKPNKPKPTKVEPVDTSGFSGKGTSRSWEPQSLLAKAWNGIQTGDNNPDEHLDTGKKPEAPALGVPSIRETTARADVTSAPTARHPAPAPTMAAAPEPVMPSTVAAKDVTKVTPKMDQPQDSRAEVARSMRETAGKLSEKATALRARGDTAGADDADRQALNAQKAAAAAEQSGGAAATLISTMAQTLPFLKDPYEHENRILKEAMQPGVVPAPREQAAIGVEHPGMPVAAPPLASPEGMAGFAGQVPAFELYGGIGEKVGGLLGEMASTIGKSGVMGAPAARAVSRGINSTREAQRLLPREGATGPQFAINDAKEAVELPVINRPSVQTGTPTATSVRPMPQIPVTKLPAARFKEEGERLASELNARLARGMTTGAEGVFGTSYAQARSQGLSREDALKQAIESVPHNIPFALGMEALGAIGGPAIGIAKEATGEGLKKVAETVQPPTASDASPLVAGMRKAVAGREERMNQLPKIPGAKTPFDTPEVIAARADAATIPPTHLIDTPERIQWRKEAEKAHFENAKQYAPNGQPAAGKEAWMVVGAPGSGKGPIVRRIAAENRAMVTDSDDGKKLSPELQANPNAAFAVHFETAKINGKVIKKAVKQGLNFVWPTVGSNPSNLAQQVKELTDAGYRVHAVYVGAPSHVAAQRVVNRWKSGAQGFVDPENVMGDKARGVSKVTFQRLIDHGYISSYAEYDNGVDGRDAQLVRQGTVKSRGKGQQNADRARLLARSGEARDGGLQGRSERIVPLPATLRPEPESHVGDVAQDNTLLHGMAQALHHEQARQLHPFGDTGVLTADKSPKGAEHAAVKALNEIAPNKVYQMEKRSAGGWAKLVYSYSGNAAAREHVYQLLSGKGELTIGEAQRLADPDGRIGMQLRLDAEPSSPLKHEGLLGRMEKAAHDVGHATAPIAAAAGEQLARHGHLAVPLAAAALPGTDDEKAKRAGLAGAIFLAPRYRRQMAEAIENLRGHPAYEEGVRKPADWSSIMGAHNTGWAESARNFFEEIDNGKPVSLAQITKALAESGAPERGVKLVSRLKKFLSMTPAENPRALGKQWDQPKPVAEWIQKLQNAAPQFGVKKEELQLLISALKGKTEKKINANLRALDEADQPVDAEHTASKWSILLAPDYTGREVFGETFTQAGFGPDDKLTTRQVAEIFGREKPEPETPKKLTRADVLKIADEALPQIERVVLNAEKPDENFAETVNHRGAAYHETDDAAAEHIVQLPEIERRLPELPWEAREDWLRQQIADRNAAKKEKVAEIRRNRAPDADDINTDHDPSEIIEEQGWDPNAMEAHIKARKKRISEIETEMEEKTDEARGEASEAYDERRRAQRRLRDLGADDDDVFEIVRDGWNGDGFSRDTIDRARQAAYENVEPPDYDPIELLRDNGYRIREAGQKWTVSPHPDQGSLLERAHGTLGRPGDVTYTPEQVQEFLAEEANAKSAEARGRRLTHSASETEIAEPDDFDVDEITEADVLRLYRSEHGNTPVEIEAHPADEYVVVNSKDEIQSRSYGRREEWRGDYESGLAYDFVSENDLDQYLRDEQYDRIASEVDDLIEAYRKEAEADYQVSRLEDPEEYDEFTDEREEILRHETAIADFEHAAEHPSDPPEGMDTEGRAAKVVAATAAFNRLNDEIDQLVKLGTKTQADRRRLGPGPSKPIPQGAPRYDGTQVSPGPREDYTELVPVWANAPVDRTPVHTHMSGGFPEDIGHERASTHLHYEIPGLGDDGLFKIEPVDEVIDDDGNVTSDLPRHANEKTRYNARVEKRRAIQKDLAALEAKLEPFDRVGIENLGVNERLEAQRLAGQWEDLNGQLDYAMRSEATAITDLADVLGLKPIRIRIMEENQADPAQTAAKRGVDRGPGTGTTPANPFMTGGTKKKVATGKGGETTERWDVNGDLTYRLGAVNFLADAVERNAELIGWQDMDTASAVHNFRRKAAKHVYEEVTPSAIRDGMRFAGIPEKDIPKPVHMIIAGAGHWVIKLTPEIKAAIKKAGLPIMALAIMAGTAKPAHAQGVTPGAEEQEDPHSHLGYWLATGLGAAVALGALGFAKKRVKSGKGYEFPEDVRELLDQTESLMAKRNAKRDQLVPRGEGYKAAFAVEDTPDGKGPAHFRLGKLGLSEEGEQLFRKVVGDPGLKRRISHETAIDVAKIRRLNPAQLLMKDKWDGIDAVAGSQFISAGVDRLGKISDEIADEKTTPERRQELVMDYARLVSDVTDIANKAGAERTEAGRTLNFYKIAAKNIGTDPQAWAMLARRAKGSPLTDPELTKIFGLLNTGDKLELSAFVNSMRPSTAAQRFAETLRMMMLSSFTTLEKITLSHFVSEARRLAMHPLAVGLDYLLSAGGSALDAAKGKSKFNADDIQFRREMALHAPNSMEVRAKGMKRGWNQAVQTLRTGASEEEVGRLDNARVNFRTPFMQAAQRFIYGMHALGYTPFREGHFEAVLNELAFVEARRLHQLAPEKSAAEIHQAIMENPAPGMIVQAMEEAKRRAFSATAKESRLYRKTAPEKDVGMMEWAAQAADEAVFQNTDSLLGAVARGARRGAETSPIGTVGTAFLFPFSTIPANIATRLVDSTPLGLVTALVRQLGGPYDQRRLANDIAYSISGTTTMMALGYMLYHKGVLTGLPPEDPGDRRLWADMKRQPLSVKIGDHWFSLADLGPEGMALALGATWYQMSEDEPSLSKKLMAETGAVGAVVAEAPFISGIREAAEAMTDPVRHGESFIKSAAGALVPAIIRRTAHAVDPVVRDTEGPLDQDMASIPGLSRRLPARRTRFGEEVHRTTAERVGEMVSPSRLVTESKDPVYQELFRLKVGLPNIRTRMFDAGKSRPTTAEERDAEKEGLGPVLKRTYEAAINDPAYARLPDETRRDLLEKVGSLPANALRYVGSRRPDATAPVDMIERRVQIELRQLMSKAVSEANTGMVRLSPEKNATPKVVPAGTAVSPEVAAYLRQQRLDARRRTPSAKTPP